MGLLFHTGMGVADRKTAQQVVDLLHLRDPALDHRYGAKGRQACVDDTYYTLLYLASACAAGNYSVFREYMVWVKALLCPMGIPVDHLQDWLQVMCDVLLDHGWGESSPELQFLAQAQGELAHMPDGKNADGALTTRAETFFGLLRQGQRAQAANLLLDLAATGTPVASLYLDVLQPCLREVGRLWQVGQLSVAEEHLFSAATQMVMSQLYPYVFDRPSKGRRMVAVCADGELHEIGIRMIADLFEMDGWDTIYLGSSVPDAGLITMLKEKAVDLLAVSVSIAVNLPSVMRLIQAVRHDPDCARVRILVGGMAFNVSPDLWQSTGADAWAQDAQHAVATGNRLVDDLIPALV